MRQNKYEYDAFISHAVEDKIPIANELCAKLERAGLKIWYSGKELGVGDSIEKTIEKGLNRSRYGIVIFSPTYLAKNWTIREFYTLLAKEIEEQKVILPVLYNITLDDLKNKDLLMADRFAVNADRGLDFVVERLVREIKKPKVAQANVAWFSRIWLVLIMSLLANVALLLNGVLPGDHAAGLTLEPDPAGKADLAAPALLGELHGLFKQMNTCTCKHPQERSSAAEATAVDASPISGFQRTSAAYHQTSVSQPPARHAAGNKMTMAVVFQFETAGQQQEGIQGRGLEDEVDDMLETITLREQQVPFIAVSNRRDDTHGSPRDCENIRHVSE